uniref:AN1-type domain-containing protein n=1 Tax=Prolemur simus TaxID=1328070 RepID=A0A8C8YF83_PROSS
MPKSAIAQLHGNCIKKPTDCPTSSGSALPCRAGEIEDVGQHCQVDTAVDLLPFACDSCSGIFCLEHGSRESHCCPEVTIINERLKTDKHKSYPCSFKDCTEREFVTVICPYCEKNFCLKHCPQSDHECEKVEIPKTGMAATQKLVKDIIDSKAEETVSLMKLKMHADGVKSLQKKFTFRFSYLRGEKRRANQCSFPILKSTIINKQLRNSDYVTLFQKSHGSYFSSLDY